MTKYMINLLQEPNQELTCNCVDDNGTTFAVDLKLRTLVDGNLCIDIVVDGETQRLSAICTNDMPLLPTNILGGNLYFDDIYGKDDPNYTEFNDRFRLIYDTEFRFGK